MTSVDDANFPTPKEELKRFIEKFEKLRESTDATNNSHLLVSLRTFVEKLDLDYRTASVLKSNMELLFNQTILLWDSKSKPESLKMAVDDAYLRLIEFLQEIVDRAIPIKYKSSKSAEIKKSKLANILTKFVGEKNNHTIQTNDTFEIESPEDRNGYQMSIFISHSFSENDKKLAKYMKQLLKGKNIYGYIAETQPEFNQDLDEKIVEEIKKSRCMIGVITSDSYNSSSVNQELGYCLGYGLPLIIMVEKGVRHGVLTQPKETQEFTKETFADACNRVIKWIETHDLKKPISDDDKKLLVEHVYRPCFNQMMNEYNRRDFITNVPSNKWRDVEPYFKEKTESYLIKIFDEYERQIRIWHEMWVEFSNQFHSTSDKMNEMLLPIFRALNLLVNDKEFMFGNSTHTPKSWLFNSRDVIFNESIATEDELYRILRDDAKRQWGEKYAESFDQWKNNCPQIYTELLRKIPEIIKTLNCKYTYQQIDTQRNILKQNIELLTEELRKRL